jgi:hypothetical protein
MKKIYNFILLSFMMLSCGNPISNMNKNTYYVFYDTMIEQSDTNKVKTYLINVLNEFYGKSFSGSKLIIEAIPNRVNTNQERIVFKVEGKETDTKKNKIEAEEKINKLKIVSSGYNDIFTVISKLNIELANLEDTINVIWISDLFQKDDKYDFTQCNKYRLNSSYDKFNIEDADSLLVTDKLEDLKLKIKTKINVIKISNLSDVLCGTSYMINVKLDNFWKHLFMNKINYNSF